MKFVRILVFVFGLSCAFPDISKAMTDKDVLTSLKVRAPDEIEKRLKDAAETLCGTPLKAISAMRLVGFDTSNDSHLGVYVVSKSSHRAHSEHDALPRSECNMFFAARAKDEERVAEFLDTAKLLHKRIGDWTIACNDADALSDDEAIEWIVKDIADDMDANILLEINSPAKNFTNQVAQNSDNKNDENAVARVSSVSGPYRDSPDLKGDDVLDYIARCVFSVKLTQNDCVASTVIYADGIDVFKTGLWAKPKTRTCLYNLKPAEESMISLTLNVTPDIENWMRSLEVLKSIWSDKPGLGADMSNFLCNANWQKLLQHMNGDVFVMLDNDERDAIYFGLQKKNDAIEDWESELRNCKVPMERCMPDYRGFRAYIRQKDGKLPLCVAINDDVFMLTSCTTFDNDKQKQFLHDCIDLYKKKENSRCVSVSDGMIAEGQLDFGKIIDIFTEPGELNLSARARLMIRATNDKLNLTLSMRNKDINALAKMLKDRGLVDLAKDILNLTKDAEVTPGEVVDAGSVDGAAGKGVNVGKLQNNLEESSTVPEFETAPRIPQRKPNVDQEDTLNAEEEKFEWPSSGDGDETEQTEVGNFDDSQEIFDEQFED